jgi:hypothetical protein
VGPPPGLDDHPTQSNVCPIVIRMAGGMSGPRGGVPLSQRSVTYGPVSATQDTASHQDAAPSRPQQLATRSQPPAADGQAMATSRGHRRRHCWVDSGSGLVEGLVTQWAQDERGWIALVVMVEDQQDDGEAVMVQRWVPAARLRPCPGAPPRA